MYATGLAARSADPRRPRSRGRRSRPPGDPPPAELPRPHRLREPRVPGRPRGLRRSVMTNKYAEGYPGRRYYAGCEFVDIAESTRHRALSTDALRAPSTPTSSAPTPAPRPTSPSTPPSCSPARPSWACASTTAATSPTAAPVNFTGKFYNIVLLRRRPRHASSSTTTRSSSSHNKEHRPKFIVAGYSAYARTVDWARFRAVALRLSRSAPSSSYQTWPTSPFLRPREAGGVHPSPVPHAQIVTSTTHKRESLRGPRGAFILSTQEHARALDRSVFPVNQGGVPSWPPSSPRPSASERGPPARFRGLRPAHRRQRQGPRRRPHRRWLSHRHRRHRHPWCVPLSTSAPQASPVERGRDSPQRRGRLRQPQHDPERPPARDGRQRPPHRHPSA